jgi:hypothetical protein
MVGTVLGTLTIAVIANGLILVKVSPFLTQIVTGAIILLAVWLNARLFGMRLPRGAHERRRPSPEGALSAPLTQPRARMTELSPAHVRSGLVMTVDGPIPSAELGVTLMHEHLQNDCRCWWNPPRDPARAHLAEGRCGWRSWASCARTPSSTSTTSRWTTSPSPSRRPRPLPARAGAPWWTRPAGASGATRASSARSRRAPGSTW